jgi:hypothetical protein
LIAWEPWLIVVGATTMVPPGDKRGYWLVHTVSDLIAQRFRVVEVTRRSEPERLVRGGVRPGEIRVADRGHARADDLALVVAGRADIHVHVAANCPRLIDQTGHLVDRLPYVSRRRGRSRLTGRWWVTKGKSSAGMPTRLVIVPREPEAGQRARELARRNTDLGNS